MFCEGSFDQDIREGEAGDIKCPDLGVLPIASRPILLERNRVGGCSFSGCVEQEHGEEARPPGFRMMSTTCGVLENASGVHVNLRWAPIVDVDSRGTVSSASQTRSSWPNLPSSIPDRVHAGNVDRIRAFAYMCHAPEVEELEAVREESIPSDVPATLLLASLEIPDA